MNYQETWKFLDNLQFFKIKLGLDSMAMFLEELGRGTSVPQRWVHDAGEYRDDDDWLLLEASLNQ